MKNLKELIEHLTKTERIENKLIIEAFLKIDRKDFVTEEYKNEAYEDEALPIGHEATISQPSTIAFMLEKLEPKKGERILEIGTGSGYVTALLTHIVGKKGKVYSIEYIPELKEFAQENLTKYNFHNIKLFIKNGKEGLKEFSPYDKIISGAYAEDIPKTWKKQLDVEGKIVTPFDNSIVVLTKLSDDKFSEEVFPGFVFVPLQ